MAQKKDVATGKWMYYGSYVNGSGKRVQYKKRGFASKKEAIREEIKFRDMETNKVAYLTFEDLTKKYMATANNKLKESSLLDNVGAMKIINKEIGHVLLSDLTSSRLQEYINYLDGKYSKKYVEKLYYYVQKVINYAIDSELINANPMAKVKRNARKNEIKREMLFWEPQDFEKFIANVDDITYKTLFTFLYYMGVRRGEAMALTWTDIDFDKKNVKINKTANAKLNNKITTPKTQNSIRNITMPKKVFDLMCALNKHQRNLYEYSNNRYVFGYHHIIPAETIRRNFKRGITKTNGKFNDDNKIRDIRIHDLRHSHASYLINNMSAGFTDFDIAKRLGDTVSTLHNTYAHWFKSADKNIINFMDNDIADD